MDRQHTLYGFHVAADGGTALLTINLTDATAQLIGPELTREIRGATFSDDGRLLVVDITNSKLLEIDPATGTPVGPGTVLTIGGQTAELSSLTDLTWIHHDDLILAHRETLYALDETVGALLHLHTDSAVGNDGWGIALAGLACEPEHPWSTNTMLVGYDVSHEDDIYAYDRSQGFARSTVEGHIIPEYNAGRGDLATMPILSIDGVEEDDATSTMLLSYGGAFPNPTSSEAVVRFSLAQTMRIRATIHDATGRVVSVIAHDLFDSGPHEVTWRGRDQSGRALPSGVYFCTVEGGGERVRGQITLVR
jgi:hypothetical protein